MIEIGELIGIILGGLIGIIAAIRRFNIKYIKLKCLSGCCECEEEMGDDFSEDEYFSEDE